MTRTPRLAAAALAAAAALSLAACGNSSSSGLIDTSSPAATSAAPTSDPTEPTTAPTEEPTGGITAAWAVSQCAEIAPPTGADAPQGAEVTTGIAVEQKTPADPPVVSIQLDTPAATALGKYDITPGTGAEVKPDGTVTANYCGIGLSSRTVFDSSWARGQAATFPLAQVIAGWTQGLPGMKVGGTRVLVIPGDLGYGPQPPQGSGIEPNETLVFVVSLTDTK